MTFQETKDGIMFDRKAYGTEKFIDLDQGNQNRKPFKIKKLSNQMLKDGFTRIKIGPVEKERQNQFQDDGKIKSIHPSTTFSGYAKRKTKRK